MNQGCRGDMLISILTSLELSFELMGLFDQSLSFMISYWLFCIQYQEFISICGACSEVVFEFEQRATYFGS